jgi:hypothetical protein
MSKANLRTAAKRLVRGCCGVSVENCGGGVDPSDVQRIASDWLAAHPAAEGEPDEADEGDESDAVAYIIVFAAVAVLSIAAIGLIVLREFIV